MASEDNKRDVSIFLSEALTADEAIDKIIVVVGGFLDSVSYLYGYTKKTSWDVFVNQHYLLNSFTASMAHIVRKAIYYLLFAFM